ncbi:MAG: hypothetical protein KDK41_07695 [Leptospiraceae bacterium]|nr:hypothetical protein [Leptospiraceae bacterium]MCB1200514.1 hypothetical protein [Leptospiraceae bacterium]
MIRSILCFLFLLILTIWQTPVSAQAFPEEADPCDENPFAVGCRVGGFGPVLGSDVDGNIQGGLGGSFGYFILPRVTLTAGAGVTFSKRYTTYSLGPDLRVHLGNIYNFIFQAGYGYSFLWVRGGVQANGSVSGPSASILLPGGKKLFFGVTAGYFTYQWPGINYSEWSYFPAVSVYF